MPKDDTRRQADHEKKVQTWARKQAARDMDERMRLRTEASMRTVLDGYYPGGIPDDLIERLCLIANALVKEVVHLNGVNRDLHDGINRIANEADLRWVDGFDECARQVRLFGEELGLDTAVIDSLLRNHLLKQKTEREESERQNALDAEASRQVQWSRG